MNNVIEIKSQFTLRSNVCELRAHTHTHIRNSKQISFFDGFLFGCSARLVLCVCVCVCGSLLSYSTLTLYVCSVTVTSNMRLMYPEEYNWNSICYRSIRRLSLWFINGQFYFRICHRLQGLVNLVN